LLASACTVSRRLRIGKNETALKLVVQPSWGSWYTTAYCRVSEVIWCVGWR
jgi:hypothetical protein